MSIFQHDGPNHLNCPNGGERARPPCGGDFSVGFEGAPREGEEGRLTTIPVKTPPPTQSDSSAVTHHRRKEAQLRLRTVS